MSTVVVEGPALEMELAKGAEGLTKARVMGDNVVVGTLVRSETKIE